MDHEPRFHGEVSEKSHKTMSNIKSKDTKPELLLRRYLWSKGIHYRKNYKELPGKPDIALTRYKIAIFVDSEFFHGKDWETQKIKIGTGTNADYWLKKITRNIERDRIKDNELSLLGWRVIHFWSKDVEKDLDGCLEIILEAVGESN